MFAKGVKVISHIKNYKLLFLFKPSSVQSHPSSKKTNVLLELPYDEINECFINTDNQLINDISIGHKIYLLHRLDSATSGIITLCYDQDQNRVRQIHDKLFKGPCRMTKLYNALTFPHTSVKEEMEHWNDKIAPKFSQYKRNHALESYSQFTPLILSKDRYTSEFNHTFVDFSQLRLFTGRTHQLRIQCAKRSRWILGDQTYGHFKWNRNVFKKLNIPSNVLFLHCSRLVGSIDGNPFVVNCPLPDYWNIVLDAHKNKTS